jgi:hypothetical protein
MKRLASAFGSLLLVAACASTGSPTPSAGATVTASPPDSATPSAAASAPSATSATSSPTAAVVSCPNPEGGPRNHCLGPLTAGTYQTSMFQLPLTYTVPAGWGNLEDLPGNFLLLPVDATLAGVNPGTSDYLGVYTSVAAAGHCTGTPSTSVPATWQGLVDWLAADPALAVTNRKSVTVAGLKGEVMDVAMKDPKGDGCPDGIYADVYVGVGNTSLVHGVVTGYRMRIYLLQHGSDTLAIEIANAPGGYYADWPSFADGVVATFRFSL